MPQRLTIVVRGEVQGVGFRWHARRQAEALGLSGWVRNESDGSVRLVAEGERSPLEALLAWARKGPARAVVTAVEADWGEPQGRFAGFSITG